MAKLGIYDRSAWSWPTEDNVTPLGSDWTYDDETGLSDALELVEAINKHGHDYMLAIEVNIPPFGGKAWSKVVVDNDEDAQSLWLSKLKSMAGKPITDEDVAILALLADKCLSK